MAIGIEEADVIAHSAGAGDAVLWAMLSERVRNLVLANPAGFIGKDAFLKLGARFQPKLVRSVVTSAFNRHARRALLHGGKRLAGPPAVAKRAFDEVVAISKASLPEAIAKLRAKGHKVGILQSRSDTVFPDKRMGKGIEDEEGELIVDAWASNIKRRAGHDEIIVRPERGAVAANQMLRSLEASPGEPGPVVDPDGKLKDYFKELRQKREQVKEHGTISQRGMAWAQTRWQTSTLRELWKESKLRESFVTGENAKRNQYIAAAVGVAAMTLMARRGLSFMLDSGADVVGGTEILGGTDGAVLPDVAGDIPSVETAPTTPVESAPPIDSDMQQDVLPDGSTESLPPTDTPEVSEPQVEVSAPRGDISATLELPEDYIHEVPDGYEVTAMEGPRTDSVWRSAEHALTDYLGHSPDVVQIDALKDILGEHLLEVGDKVHISTEQIEKALEIARKQM